MTTIYIFEDLWNTKILVFLIPQFCYLDIIIYIFQWENRDKEEWRNKPKEGLLVNGGPFNQSRRHSDIWKVTREHMQSTEGLGKQVSKADEKQWCGQEPATRPAASMRQHPSAGNRQ